MLVLATLMCHVLFITEAITLPALYKSQSGELPCSFEACSAVLTVSSDTAHADRNWPFEQECERHLHWLFTRVRAPQVGWCRRWLLEIFYQRWGSRENTAGTAYNVAWFLIKLVPGLAGDGGGTSMCWFTALSPFELLIIWSSQLLLLRLWWYKFKVLQALILHHLSIRWSPDVALFSAAHWLHHSHACLYSTLLLLLLCTYNVLYGQCRSSCRGSILYVEDAQVFVSDSPAQTKKQVKQCNKQRCYKSTHSAELYLGSSLNQPSKIAVFYARNVHCQCCCLKRAL